jgi:hypothetical protein
MNHQEIPWKQIGIEDFRRLALASLHQECAHSGQKYVIRPNFIDTKYSLPHSTGQASHSRNAAFVQGRAAAITTP